MSLPLKEFLKIKRLFNPLNMLAIVAQSQVFAKCYARLTNITENTKR